jgi:alginate O-acetyltransferase complex protein AlgI
MLFTSFPFFVLLGLTFLTYYVVRGRRAQVAVLVTGSLVFYAWEDWRLVTLLVASILVNAVISYHVARLADSRTRVWMAAGGVAFNLALLGFFKYGGLVTKLALDVARIPATGAVEPLLHIPLPIGISFYTFEGISLLVDCWRRQRYPELAQSVEQSGRAEHLMRTSLFTAFFPHLIAGPILKAREFLPQITEKKFHEIEWNKVCVNLITGYFLKCVIADNLADHTYFLAYPYYQAMSGSTALVVLFGFSMQIFADFAGYSLIAIGLGHLFGYTLPTNFAFPYMARSIMEYWRRWHMTLSTWLRDYLYIPLGGNKKGEFRTYLNLMIVMVVGGMWHGASWNFAVWGFYQGLGLVVERALFRPDGSLEEKARWRLKDWACQLTVFTYIMFGRLFFKLPEVPHAFEYMKIIVTGLTHAPDLRRIAPILVLSAPVVLYHLAHIGPVANWLRDIRQRHPQRLVPAYNFALAVMAFALVTSRGYPTAFIYFQF